MAVFWDVAPSSLVDTDRCFRRAYCLHRQDGGGIHWKILSVSVKLHSAMPQTTAIFRACEAKKHERC